ncbi:MAG: hypothetical protein AAGI91_03715 [Bacteroidota bacterium]
MLYPLVCLLCLTGCGGGGGENGLLLDLDKRNPERLLRFYLGSYLGPDGGDAFEAGLLSGDGDFRLHPERLDARWRAALDSANADGDAAIDWDEFIDFVDRTYAAARGLPPTLGAFRTSAPYAGGDPAWFTVEIDGVMTNARRHIFVPMASLRAALEGYRQNDDRLIYPVGTTLVGEHRVDGALAETTVKLRRADGFWDFFVYGADGRLAAATATEPRPLQSPTQCTGCHFGQKQFEPERSFPAAAPDGPFGPRGIRVGEAMRNASVVPFFNEHAKRSDSVLGIYGTLFVSGLLADRTAGRLAPEDAALLETLGL